VYRERTVEVKKTMINTMTAIALYGNNKQVHPRF